MVNAKGAQLLIQLLPTGQKVRFSDEWLAKCPEADQRKYRGRIGEVFGYRAGAREPIILFPKAGRFKEVKLFEVDLCRLELLPTP